MTVAPPGLTILAYAWCPSVIMNGFCYRFPKVPGWDDRLHGRPNQKEPLKVVWLIAYSFLCIQKLGEHFSHLVCYNTLHP